MEEQLVNGRRWARILAAGALWAVVYNAVWGIAWFAFMRSEWVAAMDSIHQELPFTPQLWAGWIVVTVPIGVATTLYLAGRPRSTPVSALYASAILWLPLTLGMIAWGIQDSLPVRVIVLDSAVNLAALLAASIVGRQCLPT